MSLDVIGEKPRGQVTVTGQVKQNAMLPINPNQPLTLSQAIIAVGGLGDFADKRHVRLTRKKEDALAKPPEMIPVAKTRTAKGPKRWISLNFWSKKKEVIEDECTETFIYDLDEILKRGHLEKDPELKSGDVIYVPARTWNF